MSKYLTPVLVLVVALLAITLVFKGGQVITGMAPQQNVTTTPSVTSGNVNPSVGTIACAQGANSLLTNNVSLSANASVEITCTATITDDNGGLDISSANGRFYVTSGGSTCTDDVRNCYVNSSCLLGSPSGNTKSVECKFNLMYNADNTTMSGSWTGYIQAVDASAGTGPATVTPMYVSQLLAINVPATLSFGTVNAGSDEANADHALPVSNYGNIAIDLMLNGTDLTGCTIGTIPVAKLKYYCDGVGGTYGSATALSGTLTTCTAFELAENNTASIPSTTLPDPTLKNTHWGIGVPTGTRGLCTGLIQLTAIPAE